MGISSSYKCRKLALHVVKSVLQRSHYYEFSKSDFFQRRFSSSQKCSISVRREGKRVLFFGTDSFSLDTLKTLHQSFLDPDQSVISRLEVCCYEMQSLVQIVKAYSVENGIRVHAWPPGNVLDDFDLGVVASFGQLIPKKIIDSFPLGILNVHASLLPRWRGASPIPHAIIHGDQSTGITIMQIKPKHFDIGDVLAVARCRIEPDELRPELESKLAKIGADLMLQVIKDMEFYRSKIEPQSEEQVTYAPKLTKKSFEVMWQDSTSRDVYNQWRALADLGKLFSYWQDSGVMVHLADLVHPDIVDSLKLDETGSDPGRTISVKRKKERYICVKCKSGWVAFRNFFYGPKKVMTANDFFNGYISKNRDRNLFFVSSHHLENR